MSRDTRIQFVALFIMAVAMTGSVSLAMRLSSLAGSHRLVYTDRAEEGQTWEVSAGIAMGAFRGIFVNWLWMRANDLKEAGKFYEAIELANAITKLQPRFPRVWVFHAWNMAYNISVSTETPQERWQWVNAGIRLLRDKAIPANPNDLLLHKELGWIFMHKIGGYTDDANPYYKRKLAEEWTVNLGPPPPPDQKDRSRANAIKRYVDWLRPIVDAPDTLEKAMAQEPTLEPLLNRLYSDKDIQAVSFGAPILRLYEIARAVQGSSRRDAVRKQLGAKIKAFDPFMKLYEDPQYAQAWPALLNFLRKRIITDGYHMELERMVRYTEFYGPIDWRHHGAHALYWSARGVEQGMTRVERQNEKDFDFVNSDRVVVQSIQELFRSGEVYFDFLASALNEYTVWQGAPNAHFVESYGAVLEGMAARSGVIDDRNMRGYSPMQAGYENFIRDSVCFFYRRGDRDAAEKWYKRLAEDPHLNLNDPYRKMEFAKPLPEFVQTELTTRMTSPSVAVAQVTAALMGAFTGGLLGGDSDLFRNQFAFAKIAHAEFMKAQARGTVVGDQYKRMEQMDSNFDIVAGITFLQFMQSLSLDDAAQVYDGAPETLRNYVFHLVEERFQDQIEKENKLGGPTFAKVFGRPANQDEFDAWFKAEMERRQRTHAPVEQK